MKREYKKLLFFSFFLISFIFLFFLFKLNKEIIDKQLTSLETTEEESEVKQQSDDPSLPSRLDSDNSCLNAPLKKIFLPHYKHFNALYEENHPLFEGYLKQFNSFTDYEGYKETNEKETIWSKRDENDDTGVWWAKSQNNIRFPNYLTPILSPEKGKSLVFKAKLVEKLSKFFQFSRKYYFWLKNLFDNKFIICEKIKINSQSKVYKHFISLERGYFGRFFDNGSEVPEFFGAKEKIAANKSITKTLHFKYWNTFLPILHLKLEELENYVQKKIKQKILEKFGHEILLLKKVGKKKIKLSESILQIPRWREEMKRFALFFPKHFPNYISSKLKADPEIEFPFSELVGQKSFNQIDLVKIDLVVNQAGKIVLNSEEANENIFNEIDSDNKFSASHFNLLKFAVFSHKTRYYEKIQTLTKKIVHIKIGEILKKMVVDNLSFIKNVRLKKIFFGEDNEQSIDLTKIKFFCEGHIASLTKIEQLLECDDSLLEDLKTSLKSANQSSSNQKKTYDYLNYLKPESVDELFKIYDFLFKKNTGVDDFDIPAQFQAIFDKNIETKLGAIFKQLQTNYHFLEKGKIETFSIALEEEGEETSIVISKDDFQTITNLKGIDQLKNRPVLLGKLGSLTSFIENHQDSSFNIRKLFVDLLEQKFGNLWTFLQPILAKMDALKIDSFEHQGHSIERLGTLIEQRKNKLNELNNSSFQKLNEILEVVGSNYGQATPEERERFNRALIASFQQKFNQSFKEGFFTNFVKSLKIMQISKTVKLFLNSGEQKILDQREETKGILDGLTFKDLIAEIFDSSGNKKVASLFELTPVALQKLRFLQIIKQELSSPSFLALFEEAVKRKYTDLWALLKVKNDYIAKLKAAQIERVLLSSETSISQESLIVANLTTQQSLQKIIKDFNQGFNQQKITFQTIIRELSKLFDQTSVSLKEKFDQKINQKLNSGFLSFVQKKTVLENSGLTVLKYSSVATSDQTIPLGDFLDPNISQSVDLSPANIAKLFYFVVTNPSSKTMDKIFEENINRFWKNYLSIFEDEKVAGDDLIKQKMEIAEIRLLNVVNKKGRAVLSQPLELANLWNFSWERVQTLKQLKKIFLEERLDLIYLKELLKKTLNEKYRSVLENLQTNSFRLLRDDSTKYQSLLSDETPFALSLSSLGLLKEVSQKTPSLLSYLNNKLEVALLTKWNLLKANLPKLKVLRALELIFQKENKNEPLNFTTLLSSQNLIDLEQNQLLLVKKLTEYSLEEIKTTIDSKIEEVLSPIWNLLTAKTTNNLIRLEAAGIQIINLESSVRVVMTNLFLQKEQKLTELTATLLDQLMKLITIDQLKINEIIETHFQTTMEIFAVDHPQKWRDKLKKAQINQLTVSGEEKVDITFLLNNTQKASLFSAKQLKELVKLNNTPLLLVKNSLKRKLDGLIESFEKVVWFLKIVEWDKLVKLASSETISILKIKEKLAKQSTPTLIFNQKINETAFQLSPEIIEELISFWNLDKTKIETEIIALLNHNLAVSGFKSLWEKLSANKERLETTKINNFVFSNSITIKLALLWKYSRSVLTYQHDDKNNLALFWKELKNLKKQTINAVQLEEKINGSNGVIAQKLNSIWTLTKSFLKEIVLGEIFEIRSPFLFSFNKLNLKDNSQQSTSRKAILLAMFDNNVPVPALNTPALEELIRLDEGLDAEIGKQEVEETTNLAEKKIVIFNQIIDDLINSKLAPIWTTIQTKLPKIVLIKQYFIDNPSKLALLTLSSLTTPLNNFLDYAHEARLIKILKRYAKTTAIIKEAKNSLIADLMKWQKWVDSEKMRENKSLERTILDFLADKINQITLAFWTEIVPWLEKLKKIGLEEIKLKILDRDETNLAVLFPYLKLTNFKPNQFSDPDFETFLKIALLFAENDFRREITTFFQTKIKTFLAPKLKVFQDDTFVAKIKSLNLDKRGDYQKLNLDDLKDKTVFQLTTEQFDALAALTKNKLPREIRTVLKNILAQKINKVWDWIKVYLKKIKTIQLPTLQWDDQTSKTLIVDLTAFYKLEPSFKVEQLNENQIAELDKLNKISDQITFQNLLTATFNNYQDLLKKLALFQGKSKREELPALLFAKIKTSGLTTISHQDSSFSIKELLAASGEAVIDLETIQPAVNQKSQLEELAQFKNLSLIEIITALKQAVNHHFLFDAESDDLWIALLNFLPHFKAGEINQLLNPAGDNLSILNLKKLASTVREPALDDFNLLAYNELNQIKKVVQNDPSTLSKLVETTLNDKFDSTWIKLKAWLAKFEYAGFSTLTITGGKKLAIDQLIVGKEKIKPAQLNVSELEQLLPFLTIDVDVYAKKNLLQLEFIWKVLKRYFPKLKASQIYIINFPKIGEKSDEKLVLNITSFLNDRKSIKNKAGDVESVAVSSLTFWQLDQELSQLKTIYQFQTSRLDQTTFERGMEEALNQMIVAKLALTWQKLTIPLLKSRKITDLNEFVSGQERIDITSLKTLDELTSSASVAKLEPAMLAKVLQFSLIIDWERIFNNNFFDTAQLKQKLQFVQKKAIQDLIKTFENQAENKVYQLLTTASFEAVNKPSELTLEEWNLFFDFVSDVNNEAEIKIKLNNQFKNKISASWDKFKQIIPTLQIAKLKTLTLEEGVVLQLAPFFEIALVNPVFTSDQVKELQKISPTLTQETITQIWNQKLNDLLNPNLLIFKKWKSKLINSQLNEISFQEGEPAVLASFWKGEIGDLLEDERPQAQNLSNPGLSFFIAIQNLQPLETETIIKKAIRANLLSSFQTIKAQQGSLLLKLKTTEIGQLSSSNGFFLFIFTNLLNELIISKNDLFEFKTTINDSNFETELSSASLKELAKLKEAHFDQNQKWTELVHFNLKKKLAPFWNWFRENYLSKLQILAPLVIPFQLPITINNTKIEWKAVLTRKTDEQLVALPLNVLLELTLVIDLVTNNNFAPIGNSIEDFFKLKLNSSWERFFALLAKFQAGAVLSLALNEPTQGEKATVLEANIFFDIEEVTEFTKENKQFLSELVKIALFETEGGNLAATFNHHLETKFASIWPILLTRAPFLEKSKINSLLAKGNNVFLSSLYQAIIKAKINKVGALSPSNLAILVKLEGEGLENLINQRIDQELAIAWSYLKKDYASLKAIKTQLELPSALFGDQETFLELSLFTNFFTPLGTEDGVSPSRFSFDAFSELLKVKAFPNKVRWDSWISSLKGEKFNIRWNQQIKTNLYKLGKIKLDQIEFQGNNYDIGQLVQAANQRQNQLENLNPETLEQLGELSDALIEELTKSDSLLIKGVIKQKLQAKLDKIVHFYSKLSVLTLPSFTLLTETIALEDFADKDNTSAFETREELEKLFTLVPATPIQIEAAIIKALKVVVDPLWAILTTNDYLVKLEKAAITTLTFGSNSYSVSNLISFKTTDQSHLLSVSSLEELKKLLTLFEEQKTNFPGDNLALFFKKMIEANLRTKFNPIFLQFTLLETKINSIELQTLTVNEKKLAITPFLVSPSQYQNNFFYLETLTKEQLSHLVLLSPFSLQKLVNSAIKTLLSPLQKKLIANNSLEKLFILKKQELLFASGSLDEDEEGKKSEITFDLTLLYHFVNLRIDVHPFLFKDLASSLVNFEKIKTTEIFDLPINIIQEIYKLINFEQDLQFLIEDFIDQDKALQTKLQSFLTIHQTLSFFSVVWKKNESFFDLSLQKLLEKTEEFLAVSQGSVHKLKNLDPEEVWALFQISSQDDAVFYKKRELKATIDSIYSSILTTFKQNLLKLQTLKLQNLKIYQTTQSATANSAESNIVVEIGELIKVLVQQQIDSATAIQKKEAKINLRTISETVDYDGPLLKKMIDRNIAELYQAVYQDFLKIKPIVQFLKVDHLPENQKGSKKVEISQLTTAETEKVEELRNEVSSLLFGFTKYRASQALAKLVNQNFKKVLDFLKANMIKIKKFKLRRFYLGKNERINIAALSLPVLDINAKNLELEVIKILQELQDKKLKRILDQSLNRKYGKKWKELEPILTRLDKTKIKSLNLNQQNQAVATIVKDRNKEKLSDLSDESLEQFTFFADREDAILKQLLQKEIGKKFGPLWSFLQEHSAKIIQPNEKLRTFAQTNEIDLEQLKTILLTNKTKKAEELNNEAFPILNRFLDKDITFIGEEEEINDSSFDGQVLAIIFIFVILSIAMLGVYLSFSTNKKPPARKIV